MRKFHFDHSWDEDVLFKCQVAWDSGLGDACSVLLARYREGVWEFTDVTSWVPDYEMERLRLECETRKRRFFWKLGKAKHLW